MSYVLAIEPHQGQAGILRDTVGKRTRTKLRVVDSIDDAIGAIDDEVPNLVLVSALLPPQEESQLLARLRTVPQATAPEILIIPALVPREHAGRLKRTLFGTLRRPKASPTGGCDPLSFADQLSAYLHHRRLKKQSVVVLPPAPETAAAAADRRAAARLERVDWARVLIDGAAVDLVDLSMTGAQVLASSLLLPGGSVQVTLSREAEAFCCEAGIVWGGFEIVGASEEAPWYRAGINFRDADRGALERLYFARG